MDQRYLNPIETAKQRSKIIQNHVRGHSTTTWTEFCHSLTPLPCMDSFLYPKAKRGQKQTFLDFILSMQVWRPWGAGGALYQSRGADYARQIILAPPDLQTYRRPCYVVIVCFTFARFKTCLLIIHTIHSKHMIAEPVIKNGIKGLS